MKIQDISDDSTRSIWVQSSIFSSAYNTQQLFWNNTQSQAFMPFSSMLKPLVFPAIFQFVFTLQNDVSETRCTVRSVHALCGYAQHTLIHTVVSPFCLLRKQCIRTW